jgi:hypothetical protein
VTEAAGSPPAPRRRGTLKKLAAIGVALVLGLLMAEVAARMWCRSQGQPYDALATARELRNLVSPMDALSTHTIGQGSPQGIRSPVLNPYYASEDDHDRGGVFAYFQNDARPDDYRVLLTGGSVAAFFTMTETEAISHELGRDPRLAGRRVVVLNGAEASHKQPQQLNRLALLVSMGHHVDLVVDLNGFNEMAFGVENGLAGRNPAWPTPPSWGLIVAGVTTGSPERMDLMVELWCLRNEAHETLRNVLKHGLQRSCALGQLALGRLRSLSAKRLELQQRLAQLDSSAADARMRHQVGGPDFDSSLPALLDASERVWTESSRSMRALCESRGIGYLHVLQPALFDEGAKPISAEEKKIVNPSPAWLVGARVGLPRLRAAGAMLAAEGEHFLDASRIFEGRTETLYRDPIHFTPEGSAMLRARIVERIRTDCLPP